MEHGNVPVGASKSNRCCILNHGKLMLRWLRTAIHQTNKQPGNEMFQPRHWWKCSECLFTLFTSWKRKIMENRWSIFGNRREQNFKSKAELQEVRSAEAHGSAEDCWSIEAWKCSEAWKIAEALWFLWSDIADPNLILATFAIAAERQLLRAAQNCHAWIRVHMLSHGFTWFHWVFDGPLKSNWKVLKTKCCTQKWVDKWT